MNKLNKYYFVKDGGMIDNIKNVQKPPIKLFACDFDGTLSDSKFYIDCRTGEVAYKTMNCKDRLGLQILHKNGIKIAILSGNDLSFLHKGEHDKRLGIDYLIDNVSDIENNGKIDVVRRLCGELNIGLENVAYIGDDINDLKIIKDVGYSGCPADADDNVKLIVDHICGCDGGVGCVREFMKIVFPNLFSV